MYEALGFDTDGDPTPAAVANDLVAMVVDAAHEAREDYNQALAENSLVSVRVPLEDT